MIFVVDRFEESARRYPQDKAIICEDGSFITYGELNKRAENIAELLVSVLSLDQIKTFEETQMVGLLMERTIAVVTMFLAIHKAGCAYVPVDPAFPPDRQAYIMEHSKCNVLVVDKVCYEHAKQTGLAIPAKNIFLSDDNGNIISRFVNGKETALSDSKQPKEMQTIMHNIRALNKHPQALAYVLYTSGSTGKPKGVAVKQIGVDNIIKYFADDLRVDRKGRIMGLTTFCFDISVLETFVPLTRGAAIVLASSSTRKDPFRILDLMKQNEVNLFQATPTTYEMMMATGWEGDESIQFLVGGEAFRSTLLPLAKKCAALVNVYGPTETTIWSTAFHIKPNFEDYAAKIKITGIPIGQAMQKITLSSFKSILSIF
jgi:non-ribosomal peptide synthetase component F